MQFSLALLPPFGGFNGSSRTRGFLPSRVWLQQFFNLIRNLCVKLGQFPMPSRSLIHTRSRLRVSFARHVWKQI